VKNTVRNGVVAFAAAVATGSAAYAARDSADAVFFIVGGLALLFGFVGTLAHQEM
jgi:hypothetical protein